MNLKSKWNDNVHINNDGENMLCAFCSTPFTKEMIEVYQGTYGCDTGCEYTSVTVECSKCHKDIYKKGEFGISEDEDAVMLITEEAWEDILSMRNK